MAHSIITVATMKGGSGKSTLASSLAVHWHLNGHRSAIVDADPQSTIARLAAREKALGGVPVIDDANRRRLQDGAAAGRRIRTHHRYAGLSFARHAGMPRRQRFRSGPGQAVAVRCRPDARHAERPDQRRQRPAPAFRCVLTQTTRDSVIAKHIRTELAEAGFPVLDSEMTNRVAYAEAALWGRRRPCSTRRARRRARSQQSPTRCERFATAWLTSNGRQAHEQEEASEGGAADRR